MRVALVRAAAAARSVQASARAAAWPVVSGDSGKMPVLTTCTCIAPSVVVLEAVFQGVTSSRPSVRAVLPVPLPYSHKMADAAPSALPLPAGMAR